ncbi:MAG: FRG domain-containing protein [Bacteroidales bacterium]|nr:FRG domain-containing protein [Bacteroidales bacterium]
MIGKFDSFQEFFDNLLNLTKEFEKDDPLLLLFRGQKDSEWDLLPRIARPDLKFIGQNFLRKEKDLLDEFQRLSRPYINPDLISNPWDLLALAQHHGLPTRLLDWTTNPLVALFFAFIERDDKIKCRMVWLLVINSTELADCKQYTPFNTTKTVAFKPNHITQTIISQNGWFTVHKFIKSSNYFVKLNKNKDYKTRLFEFPINNNARNEILTRLDTMGINEFTLFPGLDGLSKYLQWKKS